MSSRRPLKMGLLIPYLQEKGRTLYNQEDVRLCQRGPEKDHLLRPGSP
ncbi:MAG: hypothetical protein MZV63_57695 [Marinilabiliales bacterium]|nr:hypothetical protein [Marinilabiliales bacterium]